jgi:hypothetical protein
MPESIGVQNTNNRRDQAWQAQQIAALQSSCLCKHAQRLRNKHTAKGEGLIRDKDKKKAKLKAKDERSPMTLF